MKKRITKPITIITMLVLVLTLATPVTANAAAKKAPKLNKTKVTLTITKKKTKPTIQLKVKNAAGKKVKWSTSSKKVATVNKNGKVTAKSKGNAIITAKVSKRTLQCKVTVKDVRKPKTPEPTPTPVCQHTYEDHWTVFEEYYEPDRSTHFHGVCFCGIFIDKDAYRQHYMEWTNSRTPWLNPPDTENLGLHRTDNANSEGGSIIINGKEYWYVKTKYIDKRTCTKCGNVLTNFDTPEFVKSIYAYAQPTTVDPYAASVTPASPEME